MARKEVKAILLRRFDSDTADALLDSPHPHMEHGSPAETITKRRSKDAEAWALWMIGEAATFAPDPGDAKPSDVRPGRPGVPWHEEEDGER